MKANFYFVRNDGADSWQLCGRTGSPCMARGTLAQALETAARMAAVKANNLIWPLPVWHVVDDEVPATWNGSLNRAGEWIGRN